MKRILFWCMMAIILTACTNTTQEQLSKEVGKIEGDVEIYLTDDELDSSLNEYCLDVSGHKENANPESGLQAHTCYSYEGELGVDQVFDAGRLTDSILYMPNFDACLQLDSLEAGAAVGLAACDDSDLQSIELRDDGTIRPMRESDLCITAGTEWRRGGFPLHLIRDLSLELCGDDLASGQEWAARPSPE